MSKLKITYADKQQLNANASIAATNKCQATDLNEIKNVVNNNVDNIGDIATLTTTDNTSLVDSINELVEGQLGIKTNKILATPGAFMNANQTYNFSDSVSNQTNGIVLVWSAYYNEAPADYFWNITYVPKQLIALKPGAGVTCPLFGGGFQNAGCKYVYLTDTSVKGNAINEGSGTNSGISYNNSQYILRYVIGV